VRRIWLLGLALLAAGCGGASEALQTGPTTTSEAPEWTTFELPEARLTVSHPPDWLRAPERLMPGLVDPRELVALSTFDARRGGENCAHMPENAIEDMGPADALVVVEERLAESEGGTPSDYPPRPGHFGSGEGYPSEAVDCLDRRKEFLDRFIPFSDVGRHFYAYVAFGPETPSAVRTEAWAILDRLEIAPRSGT
jgi:hypothetical protein